MGDWPEGFIEAWPEAFIGGWLEGSVVMEGLLEESMRDWPEAFMGDWPEAFMGGWLGESVGSCAIGWVFWVVSAVFLVGALVVGQVEDCTVCLLELQGPSLSGTMSLLSF